LESHDEQKSVLLAKLTEAGGRLRVRNAMYPILWLCGLVAIPCIIALAWSKDSHPILPYVLCVVVGSATVGFLFLLVCDRDRLHSEEYLLRKQTLELIEEKGSKKAIDAATVQVISEDQFLALPAMDSGEDKK
jgi:hypothetical protein